MFAMSLTMPFFIIGDVKTHDGRVVKAEYILGLFLSLPRYTENSFLSRNYARESGRTCSIASRLRRSSIKGRLS